ncbi:hypothetical protein TSAR_001567, partial [Trichomalopsis sarcophagae]
MNELFAQNLTADGLTELESYRNRAGVFRIRFDRNYQSWETFWKAARNFFLELSHLALKFFNMCASTANDTVQLFYFVVNSSQNIVLLKK